MTVMPAAFLGHGSPMNALETNRYTSAWQAFGASVPTPRAVLVISAHWYINAMAAFPAAGVPVVQLSVNATKPLEYHLELGARLAPLRERAVLVLASGNVVHNLGGMDWSLRDEGYDWAQRFDEDARAQVLADPANVTALAGHRDYRSAVPTPDHFLPLLYLAGLGGVSSSAVQVLVDGYAYGSLSMSSYTLDAPDRLAGAIEGGGAGAGAAPMPDLPADETNI